MLVWKAGSQGCCLVDGKRLVIQLPIKDRMKWAKNSGCKVFSYTGQRGELDEWVEKGHFTDCFKTNSSKEVLYVGYSR